MKNEFKAYYQSKSDLDLNSLWKNPKTVFVFDTNVLINLYRYQKETVNDFVKLVEELKERVFIPYHVGLEYHRNRLRPIVENRSEINSISSELDKCWDNNRFQKLVSNRSVVKHPELLSLLEQLSEEINDRKIKIGEIVKRISRNELHVTTPDPIRENILKIFAGKLGVAPKDQQWLDDLYKDGEDRYKNRIPPGYKDEAKTETFRHNGLVYKEKFGDYIIWKQILEYASSNKEIENVVFITDDSKEDWVHQEKSQGNKVIGARVELVDEYLNIKAGIFSAYSSEEFITEGNDIFGLQIEDSSIKDISSMLKDERNMAKSEVIESMDLDSIKDNFKKVLVRPRCNQSVLEEVKKLEEKRDRLKKHLSDLEFMSVFYNDDDAVKRKIMDKEMAEFRNELVELESYIHNLLDNMR